MKKIITYYLTLSPVFPSTHIRAGESTDFKIKMKAALVGTPCYLKKLHTIRANYEFWRKRFEKIAAGEAVLSIRQWVGKPYGKGSTQREIALLTREDGIGIQRLDFPYGTRSFAWIDWGNRRLSCAAESLAHNDGLSIQDWSNWFKGYDLSKPLAIIHFTSFRY